MLDNLRPQETDVTGIVLMLSKFDIDPVNPTLAVRLGKEAKPQLQELGNFLLNMKGTSMAEYHGRLARAREVVGLDSTTHEENIREKFHWGPDEVINLYDLLAQAKDDEEIQFIDYKGRIYSIIKQRSSLSLLEAYDVDGTPLKPQSRNLSGQEVKINRLKTKSDRMLQFHGITNIEPIIRLVEKNVVTYIDNNGEELIKGTDSVSASRMQISFPKINFSFGMLVSEIHLVAKNKKEVDKLYATKWRIADSITQIREFLENNGSSIEVGNEKIKEITVGDAGDISFMVYGGSEGNPIRIEYYFSIKNGSSNKVFLKAGNDWVAISLQNQELDGSVSLNPIKAARTLDQFRYTFFGSNDRNEPKVQV